MTRPIVARLLHVEASPRGGRSRSAAVARRLISGLNGIQAERLALFDADLPRFQGATIEGRYALIAGERVDPVVEAEWAAIRALAEHFLSFDGWVFSVPMWNFGIPYRLKQYIDLVTQPGMTFSVANGQGVGHAAGRTAILICSGALDIRPDGPLGSLDFQIAYLDAWLRFIGVRDIRTVHIRPTYGPPDSVEAAMNEAYAKADALAASLCLPARV
jgi:FMN-dependent NADH-azoreductase